MKRAQIRLLSLLGLTTSASRKRSRLQLLFNVAERDLFIHRFRNFYLSLGAGAVLSFTIVDWVLTPEQFTRFLLARAAVIPVVTLCYFSYRLSFFRERHYAWPGLFSGLYLGWLHWFLISRSGGESSVHFMGLLLAITTMVCQMPWAPRHLAPFLLLVGGPFWMSILARWPNVNQAVVLADLLFFGAIASLSIAFYVVSRRLRRSDFRRKLQLEIENQNQAKVIDQKTREGIYLERLASQFSPQVIHSIKSGELDLDQRVRRPVSCIFIDVQNSTSKASRLDHHNYTDLMATFFEECVAIFLKHNVTVGTFLGDGILAFTNAPSEDANYQTNALSACLEVLSFHQRKKQAYSEAWRAEFNIRIGINSGYATVGFFPSRSHGTYTALGETVSLAARLCSRAEVNSVAVTKKFLTSIDLEDSTLEIFHLPVATDIKGLEGEAFEIFGLRPPPETPLSKDHCPTCAIPMEQSSVQIGAVFLRCPGCGFRSLLPKEDSAKKAA